MTQKLWTRFLNQLVNLGSDEGNIIPFSLQEELVIGSTTLMIPAGLLWGILYFFLGEMWSGLIPFSYGLVLGFFFIIFLKNRNAAFFVSTHHLLTLVLPFFLQLSLGGFINSSAVILWSFISPGIALVLNKPKEALRWFIAFIFILLLGGVLNPYIYRESNIPQSINLVLFVMNITAVMGISFTLLQYMVSQKDDALDLLSLEQEKTDNLLLNILPKEIAEILKNENRLVAEAYPEASILFADLVGFTPLTNKLSPIEMVELLNEIYSNFDLLVEKYQLEKIRTIGDNYMVASGVPVTRPDHAEALAHMALDIQDFIASFPLVQGNRLQFRIGINSGPVVAGVVGKKKFQYDVWGDMVNLASRMEGQGIAGKIQVTKNTFRLLEDKFHFESRGILEVKGKGKMKTWFLIGRSKD
jgi:guanylate cyclase